MLSLPIFFRLNRPCQPYLKMLFYGLLQRVARLLFLLSIYGGPLRKTGSCFPLKVIQFSVFYEPWQAAANYQIVSQNKKIFRFRTQTSSTTE